MRKATGLCSQTERGTFYDRFRGRVIYPVFALSGKVLAFGGRTLKTSKEVAKYVNSPESVIYHKSNELYGLYQARRAIVSADKCILVEGYMDVISMSQRGIENVVASSGTSLTEGQIALIHRFTSNVTVIYDSDPAGIKASIRGIDMLLAHGMNIKVMLLPEGDDPDSFAKAHTLEEIQAYMAANETDFIRFKARIMTSGGGADDPVARAGIISSMARSISVIPDQVLRSEYVKECARLLSTSEEIVALQVAKYRNESLDRQGAKSAPAAAEPVPSDPTISLRPLRAADREGMLRPSEHEVLRLLVRYGMMVIAREEGENGVQEYTVLDYVRSEFASQEVGISNPDLAALFDAIVGLQALWDEELPALRESAAGRRREFIDAEMERLRSESLSMSEMTKRGREIEAKADELARSFIDGASELFVSRNLAASPDDTIRRLATEMVSEKYVLSKIYTKDNQKVETERDLLPVRVPKAVYGLLIARLQFDEKDMRRKLAEASTPAECQEILSSIQQMRSVIAEIAKYLGERIILPK